jgi:hypothetical protein
LSKTDARWRLTFLSNQQSEISYQNSFTTEP